MAATHGKNAKVFANGVNLTAYMNEAAITRGADVADATAFNDASKKWLPGQQTAQFEGKGLFEGVVGSIDATFNAALAQDGGEFIYLPNGDAAGEYGHGLQGIESDYPIRSVLEDVVKVDVAVESCVGGERVVSLAPMGSYAVATTNGAAHDNLALTALGASAYLMIASIAAGANVACKIQHSADNSTWADLITFAAVADPNDPASERKATAAGATVNRYTRLVVTAAVGAATVWAGLSRNPKNL